MTRWSQGRKKLAVLTPCVMILLLPWLLHAGLAVRSETTDMRQWLPDRGIERDRYEWFVGHFGYDDFVVVSWTNCTLDDPRLVQFREQVLKSDGNGLCQQVTTPHELIERLRSEYSKLSRSEAISRLRGTLLGEDGTACTIIEVSDLGIERPKHVIQLITRVAVHECGITEDDLRLAGGIFEAVHIDDSSMQSMMSCIGLSAVIAMLIAYLSLKSLRLTLVVVIIGGYCAALSIAVIHYTGHRLNALMLVLPALLYVLVISGAVHLVNYYRDVRSHHVGERAAARTLGIGSAPCAWASITTAVGMVSLVTSRIVHVRTFGALAAISLLLALVILLAYFYSTITLWLERGASSVDGSRRTQKPVEAKNGTVEWVAIQVIRFQGPLLIISSILVLLVGFGLTRTSSSVKLERMFREDDPLLLNYRWFEDKIGPMAAVENVIQFTPKCQLSMVERLQLVHQVQTNLRSIPDVGSTMSIATFLPDVPTDASIGATMRRAAMKRKLEAGLPEALTRGFLAHSADGQLWRISARIPALREVDVVAIADEMQTRVRQIVASSTAPSSEINSYQAGTILVMHQSQNQILNDLVRSFCFAFLLICPLMMLLQKGILTGCFIMIPNCIPAMLIFGSMGWIRMPIDIGTVLTASVALGIAVDDTLHFMTWFNRGLRSGIGRLDAVRLAYRRCAIPMIQTTMICGLGLLAFTGSDFIPTSRFAWLMFALLVAALFGDLIFLPALLAGRVGALFETRFAPQSDSQNSS